MAKQAILILFILPAIVFSFELKVPKNGSVAIVCELNEGISITFAKTKTVFEPTGDVVEAYSILDRTFEIKTLCEYRQKCHFAATELLLENFSELTVNYQCLPCEQKQKSGHHIELRSPSDAVNPYDDILDYRSMTYVIKGGINKCRTSIEREDMLNEFFGCPNFAFVAKHIITRRFTTLENVASTAQERVGVRTQIKGMPTNVLSLFFAPDMEYQLAFRGRELYCVFQLAAPKYNCNLDEYTTDNGDIISTYDRWGERGSYIRSPRWNCRNMGFEAAVHALIDGHYLRNGLPRV